MIKYLTRVPLADVVQYIREKKLTCPMCKSALNGIEFDGENADVDDDGNLVYTTGEQQFSVITKIMAETPLVSKFHKMPGFYAFTTICSNCGNLQFFSVGHLASFVESRGT